MRPYIQPGMPPPPAMATQSNTYIHPGSQPLPSPPQAHDHEPDAGTLLSEWRAHHGDWVRADALAPTVRRMIDARERLPAIRQRLRLLVNKPSGGFTLEAKTVGNRARPVAFYRLVESESAGLEG
jgi:hypothetical protein